MRIFNLFTIIFIFCLSSCTNTGTKREPANDDSITTMKMATDTNLITEAIDSTHTAQNSLDWKGVYKGTLPCKDCDGIETEIMLHDGNIYMRSVKYVNSANMRERKSEGKFRWINGSTIELEDANEGASLYAVEENRIILLDSMGKKITGTSAEKNVLKKN